MRLSEMESRQAAIRDELARMDADPDTTEETDGNVRDTLIEEWEALEGAKEPVIARMEKIQLIKRNGVAPDARESGSDPGAYEGGFSADFSGFRNGDGNGQARRRAMTPEFMQRMDPFADLDRVREGLVRGTDMIARSMTVIETHNRRGLLLPERAEEATRKCAGDPAVARHALLTGHGEYIDAFRAYLMDPMGEGSRAAQRSLTLGTASGGYLLPYVLDQLQVA